MRKNVLFRNADRESKIEACGMKAFQERAPISAKWVFYRIVHKLFENRMVCVCVVYCTQKLEHVPAVLHCVPQGRHQPLQILPGTSCNVKSVFKKKNFSDPQQPWRVHFLPCESSIQYVQQLTSKVFKIVKIFMMIISKRITQTKIFSYSYIY